ncbi:MAG: 8-oxo-dGTP diphosphatase [Flavobacteriales bacterium]|jgi:8-oxo-dGTP diphosphatase
MIDVVAAILEKENQVVIARRKTGKHLEGFWEFPGGKNRRK